MLRSLLVLASWGALALPLLAQGEGHAKIEVAESSWEFGEVDQGFEAERLIVLKNAGAAELRIQRVGVTCGCITASAAELIVAPGSSTTVRVNLDTTLQSGHLAKHVFVDSNDPSRPKLLYLVTGVVRPVWWLAERSLHFGELEVQGQATRRLRVEMMPGRKTKVVRAASSDPRVVTVIEPWGEIDGPHGFDVSVTLAGAFEPGAFRSLIEIVTDDPLKASEQVSLQAEILGAIALTPDRLRFGGVERGASKTLTVRLTKRFGDGLEIERISCSDARITVEVEETDPGRSFELRVTLEAVGTEYRVGGRIVVMTNDPSQRLLYLPFQGAIRP